MKLFNFDVCRVTTHTHTHTHTHTPYGRTALISMSLLVLCFLCATPIQAQTTHINNITVEAGGRLHIEVIPPPVAISVFMALDDAAANAQFAGKTLRLTGTAGSISDLFAKLKAAEPADIILTEQTGTVPATAFSGAIGNFNNWLKSFRADKMTEVGGSAFRNCKQLTGVSLPEATTIGESAFNGCLQLSSVSLPEATTIGDYALAYCYALTSVSLPEATTIGNFAFVGCIRLTSVSLPKATSIGDYAFYNCDVLSSVSLPKATSIGDNAFYNCSNVDVYLSEPFYTNPTGHPWGGTNIRLYLI